MNLQVRHGEENLIKFIDEWCERTLRPHTKLFVPAGNTPVLIYRHWERSHPSYLDDVEFLQIDDIVSGPKAGLFKSFFIEHLPSFQKQMRYIENCDVQADAAILGIGLNVHVAFHEPEIAKDFYGGCVKLSPATCKNLGSSNDTWGISYGLSAFSQVKHALMIAFGESKRSVLSEMLSPLCELPSAHLARQPQVTVLTDLDLNIKIEKNMVAMGNG